MFRKKVKKILISSSFLISSTSVCILSSSCDSIFNPFSPAFNLLFYMKEVENGERIEQTAKINSFDEFKNLCSDGRADYEISGVTIPRNNVCGIKFAATGLFADGSKLSYIPNNFLYNCKAEYWTRSLTFPNSVEAIHNKFFYQDNKDGMFNSPISFPRSLITIGTHFMWGQRDFNQPINLPDEMQDAEPDPSIKNGGFAIGEYFMNYCNSFNQPFSIPKKIVKIANYFLSRMDSFNSKVTLHNELRWINEWFLSKTKSFNQDIDFNKVEFIGRWCMAQTDAKIENYDVIITPPNSNAQFNSQVKFSEELLNIEEGFLVGAVNFNQKIIFPYTLQHVKTGFLGWCTSFNQDMRIPDSMFALNGAIWKRFLFEARSFCSTIDFGENIPINFTGGGYSMISNYYSLTTTDSTSALYTIGPTIKGLKANFIKKFLSYNGNYVDDNGTIKYNYWRHYETYDY